jgi:hypothetical protein
MINTHEKLIKGDLTVEVNWIPEVTPCKQIKLIIDGNEAVISNSELYSLLLFLSDEDQKDKLFKSESKKVKQVTKMVKVKTKKAIKANDYIVFPLSYWVSEDVYDQIAQFEGLNKGLTEEEAKQKLNS